MRATATAQRIASVLDSLGEEVLRLAYHAAVPVVVDAPLLNLLRVNFFLDPPDSLTYEAEADLLLSPLFREIGEGLYEIEPGIRNLLLSGLYSRYGADRVRRVALLLEQYTDATPAWRWLPELERAQQLTAVSFLDPIRAEQWLERNAFGASSEDLDREWYVAIGRHIADSASVITADQGVSDALARLEHEGIRVRLEALQALDALTRLPEVDAARVFSALCGFINTRAAATQAAPGVVSPDLQAALSLMGRLPHDEFELNQIVLNGVDLAGLNFSKAKFTQMRLVDVNASGIILDDSRISGEIINSVMDGASLNNAGLSLQVIDHVSLVGASLVNATLVASRVQTLDLSGADLRQVRVNFKEVHDLLIPDSVDIADSSIDDVAEFGRSSSQGTLDTLVQTTAEAQSSAPETRKSPEKDVPRTTDAPIREAGPINVPGPPGRAQPGIAMLGVPGSGKTTFLAALQVALLRLPGLGWSLRAQNQASAQTLVTLTDDLITQHRFPPTGGRPGSYQWSLEGLLPSGGRTRSVLRFRRQDLHVRLPLHSHEDLDSVLSGTGIMFFFDPVGEFQHGENFRYANRLLTQLRSRAQFSGKLPHYVAVCITKFDEIAVLESAMKLRIVEYDPVPPEFPAVPDEYAQEFFERLCRVSRSDNAEFILPLLRQTFQAERIRFFVTSSIGFYVNPGSGVFDPDDYQNHIPGDPSRIRGGIYPINVAEPMLWLGRNAAR